MQFNPSLQFQDRSSKMGETHVVEIPSVDEGQQMKTMAAIQHHPLTEISHSPGHLLLLKLWQREDLLFARRIAMRETRLHSLKREVSHLCTSFLLFHGLFLTLLFAASSSGRRKEDYWWIPFLSSLATSLVIAFLVQAKLRVYWKVERQLQRERGDNRALGRLEQELRMKGAAFDLSKGIDPSSTRRMKSSSVEINWRPIAWCRQYAATICLLCFTGLIFPASKLILCVF